MSHHLPDLLAHQAWADALHWRAFRARPIALEDAALRERLHHIHLVQQGFLTVLRDAPFRYTEVTDYPDFDVLLVEARRFHQDIEALAAAATPADLAREVTIPWFEDPPCRITMADALHQVVMHSHYHRGQNATRLRELGGEPPLTDFIVWLWKGRPRPEWP
jgi:uncharacterized damage-inducible protein DinB